MVCGSDKVVLLFLGHITICFRIFAYKKRVFMNDEFENGILKEAIH